MSKPSTPNHGPRGEDSGEQRYADMIQRLNSEFYRASPHRYFIHRVSNLLVDAHRATYDAALMEEVSDRLGESFSFVEDEEQDDRRWHLATEASLLRHHVSETLLRLYLGHLDSPLSPRLQIAKTRNFSKFKKQVRNRILAEDRVVLQDCVQRVFYGDVKQLRPALTEEVQKDLIEFATGHLRHAAKYFLEDAPFYNAAKHGLAINAGGTRLTIVPAAPEGQLRMDYAGPTLDFLEQGRPGMSGSGEWQRTTKWVDIGEEVATSILAIGLIETLWSIARCRYADAQGVTLNLRTRPTPRELVGRREHPLERMSVPITARPLPEDQAQQVLRAVFHDREGDTGGGAEGTERGTQ